MVPSDLFTHMSDPGAAAPRAERPGVRMWLRGFLVTNVFAVFPLADMYVSSGGAVALAVFLGPFWITSLVNGLLLAFFKSCGAQPFQAAATLSVAYILGWSYGSVGDALWNVRQNQWFDSPAGVGSYLFGGLLVVWLFRRVCQRNEPFWRRGVEAFCVFVVLVLTVRAALWLVPAIRLQPELSAMTTPVALELGARTADSPDIYYIVLDGMGRLDLLREAYGWATGPIIRRLSDLGFYTAESALSNYAQTHLSLAASLNMEYLDAPARALIGTTVRAPLRSLIESNRVARSLKTRGYQYVLIGGDYALTARSQLADTTVCGDEAAELRFALARLTILRRWLLGQVARRHHRETIQCQLSALRDRPGSKAPQFIFAHIPAPHPPFVFDVSGRPVSDGTLFSFADTDKYDGAPSRYRKEYRSQAEFILTRLLDGLEGRIRDSPSPPIVIIQGDHGPGADLNWDAPTSQAVRERMAIMLSVYVPARYQIPVYSTLTPVNLFRLVFNAVFGTALQVLPDQSYYSSWMAPYDFRPFLEPDTRPTH
jgi:hypothetical protein